MTTLKPREIAIKVLNPQEGTGEYAETRLEMALVNANLSSQDRRLVQELVYGLIRWQATLDWLIARKGRKTTQQTIVQTLLRLGLYQMFWLDRIPNYAAVNETVELAKQYRLNNKTGFLNAVLRAYEREKEPTRQLLKKLQLDQPELGYSHPCWLWERWQARWGGENARQLLEWNNLPPPTYARLNVLRSDAPQLSSRWRQEGIVFTARAWPWAADQPLFQLDGPSGFTNLGSFQDGWFYVQDPSTLLAVYMVDPQPGEQVLDICAAPGGKTTLMAQRMNNQGRILATDIQADRLKMVQENCLRLGVTCVDTSPWLYDTVSGQNYWDKILVDAPCSNTGVMRRRVELRWRLRPKEILRLQKTQIEILAHAAPLLKPNGILVYSTCSLEPEENAEVVKGFLHAHPNYQLELERQLLPFVDNVDGAYVARLRRDR